MSYNRWMPPECSTELYHHGVKGMKWGKHLFGKSADIQVGAGGGGGSNEEDLKLLEELKKKYGDKALEMFKKIKQRAAGVPKTVGLTDYTEYKKAQKDYEKLLKDYNDKYVDDHPATYLKPSDEKKKAKQKLGSAEFHRDVQKEQYEQTPLGKTVSKAESGMKKVQQMVRDIKGDRKGTRTKLQNRRRR